MSSIYVLGVLGIAKPQAVYQFRSSRTMLTANTSATTSTAIRRPDLKQGASIDVESGGSTNLRLQVLV